MKKIFTLLFPILVFSCNPRSKTNQDEKLKIGSQTKSDSNINVHFDWLIGNWKRVNEVAGKETFENWEKISSNKYSGIGYTLQNGDTISQEKMDIMVTDTNWKLIVKIPKEKQTTEFKITEIKTNEFICINDSNDFPKRIKYWLDGDIMKANISNNKMEIHFEFKKIK